MNEILFTDASKREEDFSIKYVFGAARTRQVEVRLAETGIRLMPYGFASALAVVSDVDSSSRLPYAGYIGSLVDELGLDFGDSTWLRCQSAFRGRYSGIAFGFFSRSFGLGRDEAPEYFETTRTFNESVGEFHKGNVDHFHSFLSRGVRIALIQKFEPQADGRLVADFGEFQRGGPWGCGDIFVAGVCVVTKPGTQAEIQAVEICEQDGTVTDNYRPARFRAPPDGRAHHLLTIQQPADAATPAPRLDAIKRVTIQLSDPQHASNVERILLVSETGDLLIDRLKFLRDRFNVAMNLVTEHAGQHFRNPFRSPIADRQLQERIKKNSGPTEAYNGSLCDDDGALVFSSDSDHPHSLGRVFPELSTELDFRFVVPHAATSHTGWHPFNLVTPSATRSGGGIYWARRTLPNIAEPVAGRKFDSHSRQDTFARRIARMLSQSETTPGLFWPIYTHLGGLLAQNEESLDAGRQASGDHRGRAVPSPYFDIETMRALQDRVFNISGKIPPPMRIWFTRASALYDYALIVRSIAGHARRVDPNTLAIRSWKDAALGKALPSSLEQLYGLTFYCDDVSKASVLLDGERIETLVVNPPDQTGRKSATIAACGIRFVLFDQLNPIANAPNEAVLEGGAWRWRERDAGPPAYSRLTKLVRRMFKIKLKRERWSHGRLTVTKGVADATPRVAALTVPLHGWTPTGAQLLSLRARVDPGAKIGLLFETQSGGMFYFGDEALGALRAPNAVASYCFDGLGPIAGEWRTLTIPFHDLVWGSRARPGGPMPSHAMKSFTLLACGEAGQGVDIGGVTFLRPRANTPRSGQDAFCLGGYVRNFEPAMTISAVSRDQPDSRAITQSLDQRGHFCFDRLTPGVYKVWSNKASGAERHDRRGLLVEVGADTTNLVLG